MALRKLVYINIPRGLIECGRKMSESLEEYCRRSIREELSVRFSVPNVDLRSQSMHLLSTQRELDLADDLLNLENQDKKESLRQRVEELKKKEENHKEVKLESKRMNDAKQSMLLKKVETEKAEVSQMEQKLQQLDTDFATLLDKKEKLQAKVSSYRIFTDYLLAVLEKTKKFHSIQQLIVRFEVLLSTREHLLKRQREAERARELDSSDLGSYVSERRLQVLQYKNALTDLQTDLENAEEQSFRSECEWNHIVTTATKNTLLLGQIKFSTFNLYHMTGGAAGGTSCVGVDNTVEQLSEIQCFIEHSTDIIKYLEGREK